MTELKRVVTAFFSPTGGCKKVSMALQDGFIEPCEGLEFSTVSFNCLTPLKRERSKIVFTPQDLLVFTFPVFYGRMPWALQDWKNLQGHGAKAVIVTVYGNRAIEDATREAAKLLTEQGFCVIGNIEALAEHSNLRTMAHGRPNEEDKQTLKNYAKDILKLYQKAIAQGKDIPAYTYDFATPLKERAHAAGVPHPDCESCDHCGRCAAICPMHIIDPQTMTVKEEDLDKCMACRACMQVCPNHGRNFSENIQHAIQARMEQIQAANPNPYPYRCFLSNV